MFIPTLALGILWIFSTLQLYMKYVYTMSITEQQVIWGCLKTVGWLWPMRLMHRVSGIQEISLFVLSSRWFSRQHTTWWWFGPKLWGKEVVGVVCVLLWGAVAGNGWLWVACWTVFPNAVWLHVLNAILWLHGILWDAGIWYVSWTHELRFLA